MIKIFKAGIKSDIARSSVPVSKLEVVRYLVKHGYIKRGVYEFYGRNLMMEKYAKCEQDETMLFEGEFNIVPLNPIRINKRLEEPYIPNKDRIEEKQRLLKIKKLRENNKAECRNELERWDFEELKWLK